MNNLCVNVAHACRPWTRRLIFSAVAGIASVSLPGIAAATITLTQTSNTSWSVGNGQLNIVFDPAKDNITSIQIAGDSTNLLDPANSQLYEEFAGTQLGSGTQSYHVDQTANYIDVWTTTASNGTANPLTYSFHYLLFNNDPAIHAYEVLNHSASDPATSVGQGQFLMRVNSSLFPNSYQANVGPNNIGAQTSLIPPITAAWSQPGRNVQDATTDLTGIEPGSWGTNVYTKYDYSAYSQFNQAKAEYGSKYAVSTVYTTQDTMTGGPTKQDLQFTNNILMQEFLSGHYGDSNYSYTMAAGQVSQRLFGPYTFRITNTNNETGAQIYQDDLNSIPTYEADYNTDKTLTAATGGLSLYVPSYQRGAFQASVGNAAGWSSDTTRNTIVLSDNGTDFQESHQGYQYWAQLSQGGAATINDVVPGTYRASIYQLGQWGETRVDGVTVTANQTSVPKNLSFTPENFGTAAPIWTIGTPDRSGHEFLDGHATNANPGVVPGGDLRRFYGTYDYWAQEQALGNPGKVVYYATSVGSTPATNDPNKWIMNQWGKFNPGMYDAANGTTDNYKNVAPAYVQAAGGPGTYTGAPWEVHFALTQSQLNQGQYAVLSVGLAAVEASLTVTLNGHSATWHELNASDPMVRSGVAGYYQFLAFQFPVADLSAAGADNTMTFGVSQTNGVLYDALRFEVTNKAADHATTGWYDYEYINGSTNTAADNTKALTASNASTALAPRLTWNNAAATGNGSTWDNNTNQNWNTGAAPAKFNAPSPVIFSDSNNGHYAVSLNTAVAPSSVLFNNSAGNYSVAGSGSITGSASLTTVGASTVTLSTVNTYTGGTNVNGGTLIAAVSGAIPLGDLSVSSVATMQLASNSGSQTVSSLEIATGGHVNLTNNPLSIHYGAHADPIASIAGYIATAYNGGAWNGTGIMSSSIVGKSNYAIGYGDAADGNIAGLASNTVLVKPTLIGDANLDGTVNFADYQILLLGYLKPNTHWDQGNFNYDGTTDFADYQNMLLNFANSSSLSAADIQSLGAIAQANGYAITPAPGGTGFTFASVPEPATVSLSLLVAGAGLTRRRSKHR